MACRPELSELSPLWPLRARARKLACTPHAPPPPQMQVGTLRMYLGPDYTNNEAEYNSLIEGLKARPACCGHRTPAQPHSARRAGTRACVGPAFL